MEAPEILFQSDVARVRLMKLEPREIGEKHQHSRLFETIICVEGEVALFVAGTAQPQVLLPGEQASVLARMVHWLENTSDVPARYILAQSGGEYDFLRVA